MAGRKVWRIFRWIFSIRHTRIISYMLLSVAGVALILQINMFSQLVNEALWYTMAGWLAAGGTLAAIGQLTKTWPGEYIGLPLVYSSLFGFSILQGVLIHWPSSYIPSLSLLWAFSLVIFDRWRDVRRITNLAMPSERVFSMIARRMK